VLVDILLKLFSWRKRKFDRGLEEWLLFLESEEFEKFLLTYCKDSFRMITALIPKNEEPRSFFVKKDTSTKFLKKVESIRFISKLDTAFRSFKKKLEGGVNI
jgi:hypothetical protein